MDIQSFEMIIMSRAIQAFSSMEILDMIDQGDLDEIKKTDPHPYFKAYVLAHEGVSRPRFAGESNPIKVTWPRKLIQAMTEKIKKGIKFFSGHNADNSTTGRVDLGRVVASRAMEIDGKMSNVVVGYFPPNTREQVMASDVSSMEAEWYMKPAPGGVREYITKGIKTLTGIALGNGNIDKPAFAGATQLAAVQAFENTSGGKPQEGKKMSDITYNDVENFVKNRNVKPSQLFTWEDVKKDRVFLPELKEQETKQTALKEELEKLKGDAEKLQKEKQDATISLQKITAKEKIAELIKDKPEKLKAVILRKAEKWNDFSGEAIQQNIAELEEDFKPFLAAQDDKTKVPTSGDPGKSKDENDPMKAENNPALNWDAK